jgi:hypothetical protein
MIRCVGGGPLRKAKTLAEGNPSLKWQYFGDESGTSAFYPGMVTPRGGQELSLASPLMFQFLARRALLCWCCGIRAQKD